MTRRRRTRSASESCLQRSARSCARLGSRTFSWTTKNTQGEEVKLAKLPKQVLAKEADATSAKIIQDLKDITAKLGSELEDMHGVADNACRQLSQPFPV